MPHLEYSHKSEELFLNKSLAIDAARVATRTSSVRVRAEGWLSRSHTERRKTKASHPHISSRETPTSTDRSSGTGTLSHSQFRALKLPALFDGFIKHMHEHQEKPTLPSSRSKPSPKEVIKADSIAYTFEPAHLSDGVEQLPVTLPAAKTVQQRVQELQKKSERKESNITDVEDEVWYECDQSTSQGTEEVDTAKQEYRARIWWGMVRLALQVDLEFSSECLPAPDAQSYPKSWRYSRNNFFPPRFSHLDQNEVIAAVLDERRRYQQPKGESLLFRNPTWA